MPVLALGEALQLRNLVHMPALQAYTTRRFRFPFPFWLGGRWGVSPLPSAVPLVYVIGEPLPPPGAPRGAAGAEGAGERARAAGANGGVRLARSVRPPRGSGGVPRVGVKRSAAAVFNPLTPLMAQTAPLPPPACTPPSDPGVTR